MRGVSVEELLSASAAYGLELESVSGSIGLQSQIVQTRIQKPGLALAGFTYHLHPDRLQVLGATEMTYLSSLEPPARLQAVRNLCDEAICCLAITTALEAPADLLAEMLRCEIPVVRTSLSSSTFIDKVTSFLEDRLSERTSLHGVLVDVLGIGMLLLGKSGIGKSECALDLVVRGYRLVADDIVEVQKKPPSSLIGSGLELIKHHMEIRGLGIINVKDLFGIAAIRETKKIELVVELVEWRNEDEYERLGFDEMTYEIMGIPLPMIRLPVRPGRNLTTIIEVAARNHLLKIMGHNSAVEFQRRLTRQIAQTAEGVATFGGEVE
jgi:HPr kinase/phosphorylase